VFRALREIRIESEELELKDAIQLLVELKLKLCALRLKPGDIKLEISTSSAYWETSKTSHETSKRNPQDS
jgi:hypothetical protein